MYQVGRDLRGHLVRHSWQKHGPDKMTEMRVGIQSENKNVEMSPLSQSQAHPRADGKREGWGMETISVKHLS